MSSKADQREEVRELARRVAAIAASPGNEAIRRRWRDVNALRKPDRPPVWCRPVGAWQELLPASALVCTDAHLRAVEYGFRQILIKNDIGDDSPLEPWYGVPVHFDVDPPNLWGVEIRHHGSGQSGGAWAYDPPLREAADFDKLRVPVFQVNRPKTDEALGVAQDLLGNILPVRAVCNPPLGATLVTAAADLRGLTPLLLDLAESPELAHRLMTCMRDATLNALDVVERSGLLTPNTHEPMACSEPIGEPRPDGSFGLRNLWAMANSQEFDPVSPAMWEEFLLAYQRPILDRFGLTAYGCCENLTRKIDGVLSIPNLRIFVCSAWTDLDTVISKVDTRYVIMWRQKATDVVFAPGAAELRRGLEEGLRRLKGCYVQVVLRELQTLAGHPRRLHEWTRAAIEMAAKFA